MTTDPPSAEFEDVWIDNWQSRLPSAICTNKEIFDEIFSIETWKTVLQQDQRDRILKMLPPEVLKIPGAAERTIEDLFSKSLSNFGNNPLDTFYDKLDNGHYDPEVVETKTNIVREWKRESFRLKKHYHTKLLQDIVISRDQHLRKLIPPSPVHIKKNGKKSLSSNINNNGVNGTGKKNGKGVNISLTTATNANATNGTSFGSSITKGKNYNQKDTNISGNKCESTTGSTNGSNRNNYKTPTIDQSNNNSAKSKRGRLDTSLLSPQSLANDGPSILFGNSEGPMKKKAKNSPSKSKANTLKKSKDSNNSASQPPPSSSSLLINSPLLLGNGTSSHHSKTSLLLGTLTTGSSQLEPPTLSLRSPSSLSGGATSSSSLLESLTSPINSVAQLNAGNESNGVGGTLSKQYSKIFPSPVLVSSPVSTNQSPSFLPSPVQSSPILASQLQAPSPISVNLSTITGGGLSSSRNGSISGSPSHSSITLNYTQPPTPTSINPPSATITSMHQQTGGGKGLLDEESSDEFEFETIEPTIGLSGPFSSLNKSSPGANLKSSSPSVSGYNSSTNTGGNINNSSNPTTKKLTGTISNQELANIQKCSLLTNCLTQPLSSNSSSNAAVTAALANNILTSTPVPVSATVTLSGAGSSSMQRLLQQQSQSSQSTQKILVSSSGLISSSTSTIQSPHQQLQKFLSTQHTIPSSGTATMTITTSPQKNVNQSQHIGIFQQQQQLQKNVISATPASGAVAVDAQTFVNTLMANSKDLLSAFGSSVMGGVTNSSEIHQVQMQQHSSLLPISLNLQGLEHQQSQLKHATYVRTNSGSVIPPQQPQLPQSLLSLQSTSTAQPIVVVGQNSSLNTQSLQLPSSILTAATTNNGNVSSNGNKISITGIPASSVVAAAASIPNLLDSDDLNLGLGSFTLGSLSGMSLDIGGGLSDIDSTGIGGSVGVDGIKLEMDCGMDKMDDLSGVLDGNPFDSIPNLSDELDGLDLDMVDGLCDFEVLLSEEKQYASFFSLIRDVLCSTRDHRMTLVCLEKTLKKWAVSPAAALNPWYMKVPDWSYALIVGLNFLAGNYQDVHPEDFVPYIEYKYKTKYYQWIGAGRDGDNNLTPLCTLWMDNMDKLPPLRRSEVDGDDPEEEEDENEDSDTGLGGDASEPRKKNKRPQTPPPPRCTTEWAVRPSTETEKEEFRCQEKHRFENPHKAFTYRMHGYESVVGPVKGVYSSQTGVTNKARGHSLLVDDRPPYVTILALVRDAVARLPNGEGTRSEICEMLRDSTFLAPEASNVTLNSVVSGALDRLHYERDPCVRYDSHKKSWIYLHRDRSQEQFERLHHNRSYTKSTKSRNNSSRKSRKGSKSSSSSSTGLASATTGASQSSSSSSSQCSTSAAVESSLQAGLISSATVVGIGGASGGSTVTSVGLPALSTINPKLQNQLSTLTTKSGSVTQQQQSGKQAIGIVSVTNSAAIQMQTQQATQSTGLAGTLQQTLANGRGGIVSIPVSSAMSIQDGTQQVTQQQASLNEVLAAAAGLRFQTATGGSTAPVVLNQNMLASGTQQAGKTQQSTFIQDTGGSGATARLVLQQQPGGLPLQHGTQAGIQVQSQQQGTGTQAAIAPGQILLGSSAGAVLKLAGNIRLSDGLRLAQLRLPTGTATHSGTSALSAGSTPLRLPQHRILLARGTLPGQSQAQGVLLGQTSTGQTVILSASPAGAGPLAGLQQALAAGGSGGSTGQIALHATTPTIQLDSSSNAATTTLSTGHQSQQQTGLTQQNLQAFANNPNGANSGGSATPKFGIIANVPQGANPLVAASSASVSPIIQSSYSTLARIQHQTSQINQQPTSTSTLPSTSISLPASILAPSQTLSTTSTGAVTMQSPPNITVSTSQLSAHQQQLILTTSTGTPQPHVHTASSQQITTLGMSTVQLQSAMQQQSQQQNLILQPQTVTQAGSSHAQQQQSQTQSHHQLTAPIIIRSAQGDFVSFGIPSHLSLGRGVQGIKVIPFQTGKQTVLARIVAPPQTSSSTISAPGAITTTIAMPATATSLSAGSGKNLNAVVSTISNLSNSSSAVQLTNIPVLPSSSPSSFSTTTNVSPNMTLNNASPPSTSSAASPPTIVAQPTPPLQPSPVLTTSCPTQGGAAVVTTTAVPTTVNAVSNSDAILNNQSSSVTVIAPGSVTTTTTSAATNKVSST